MINNFVIRPATEADCEFILRLNKENVEVLAPMDRSKLTEFMKMSSLLWVACVDGKQAAFIIVLDEGVSSYDSENYLWFKKHYEHFLYIDRIVIDAPFRKIGLGRTLYNEVFDYARDNVIPVVTAEIDTIPYNGASLKFHRIMGFKEVGEQYVRGGSVKVSLQAAEICCQ